MIEGQTNTLMFLLQMYHCEVVAESEQGMKKQGRKRYLQVCLVGVHWEHWSTVEKVAKGHCLTDFMVD